MTHLLATPTDRLLNLEAWVGQRSATFRFELTDGVTGERLGDVTPLRGGTLTHDTTRTIKRQLTLNLGVSDTANINPLTDRIAVFMVFPGNVQFPLGRYMFTDSTRQLSTAGKLSNVAMNDEMFLVDQQITTGITAVTRNVLSVILEVLATLPIDVTTEASPFTSAESWGPGVGRGQVIESLAVSGDYFSPWFGNDGQMHFIRAFDPATRVPDFDFDENRQVLREAIVETDNLLTAPNRFIVISNNATNPGAPVVGSADVPVNAPHSIPNRGFVIASVQDLQLSDSVQATAVAQNLAQRQTTFEQVRLSTPPDPRHDSYNVIRWQEELWLELGWSMSLVEGGAMSHTLRKSYT
jgi:hypothetical protein